MPSLDFSDVLSSVEFVDTFFVVQTISTIGSDGVSVGVPGPPIPVSGIVVPGKSSTIRGSDGQRVTAFIDVFTTFRLSDGTKANDVSSRQADVVTWHGQRFTVIMLEDYSAFGAGFIKASCDLLDLNPPV